MTHTYTHSFAARCKCPQLLCYTATKIYQIVRTAQCVHAIVFVISVTILTWIKTVSVIRMLTRAGQGAKSRSSVVYILLRDGEVHKAIQKYKFDLHANSGE